MAGKSESKKNEIKQAETVGDVPSHRFVIRLGIPGMEELWNRLTQKYSRNDLSADEADLYRKLGKAMHFLSCDPFHKGLHSHEIVVLSKKYGQKIFESYLENKTSGAVRMFWVYGPERGEITVLAVEQHPERGGYKRVKLSLIK